MTAVNYRELVSQAKALIEDVPHLTANLANVAALIYHTLPQINWAGFYLTQDERLVLGPFQGRPACVEIAYGRGVCGTAAAEDRTLLVPDVHRFAGHIACDSASRSELVIPLHSRGRVVGVLDIDSPVTARFSDEDRLGLAALTAVVEQALFA